jgi:hypothetical protein
MSKTLLRLASARGGSDPNSFCTLFRTPMPAMMNRNVCRTHSETRQVYRHVTQGREGWHTSLAMMNRNVCRIYTETHKPQQRAMVPYEL